MIPEEQLQAFIDDRVVTKFGNTSREKNLWTKFVLNYYDAYALMALTQSNIIFMDEEVMQLIKPHKKKLFFRIVYEPKFRTFELRTIIFGAPMTQCILIINEIKKVLKKHNIGTYLDSITHKDKKTYTSIDIVKIFS